MKNKRPAPAKGVLFKSKWKEGIILDVENGNYRFLNKAGGYLWKEMDGKRLLSEIAGRFSEKYGIPREQAAMDVEQYFEELRRERFVRFL
ncbi:MAG: PqqD family protein [Candidatus Omnitrophota bacterium]|nr:PqqD family protein [Candidatus Omnitrophota bacterium]